MHGHRETDPDSAQYLIQVIVDRAATDYLHAPEESGMRQDAEKFFLSEWFECLTGFDGRTGLKDLFQSTPIAGRHFGEDSLPSPTALMIPHAMMEDQANHDH